MSFIFIIYRLSLTLKNFNLWGKTLCWPIQPTKIQFNPHKFNSVHTKSIQPTQNQFNPHKFNSTHTSSIQPTQIQFNPHNLLCGLNWLFVGWIDYLWVELILCGLNWFCVGWFDFVWVELNLCGLIWIYVGSTHTNLIQPT